MKIKGYHISPLQNREEILKKGLIPKEKKEGRIQYGPRIFFSKNRNNPGLDYVNFENVDCWEFEIDSKFIQKDEFSRMKDYFFTEIAIKPENLKLIKTY